MSQVFQAETGLIISRWLIYFFLVLSLLSFLLE